MTTLVLVNRSPQYRVNGYDLRVYSLCRFLEKPLHLVIFPINAGTSGELVYDLSSVFESCYEIKLDESAPLSFRRHFRFSDSNFLRSALPATFAGAVRALNAKAAAVGATRTIVFGTNLAELAHASKCPRQVIDVCDSVSLTVRREQEAMATPVAEWPRRTLQLLRSRRSEAVLPSWFKQVTTISEADSNEIRTLAGSAVENVHTIPNGVDDALLSEPADPPTVQRRGVVFWGNLSFAPNREAMRFFFDSVYSPFLRNAGISVRIIGRSAERWLTRLAQEDPNVEVLGYVDDLRASVADFPVLINPMVMGSGLKNKVLEAFGLRLAVVSTPLGMEAFPEAISGQHYLAAPTPSAFADAVLRLLGSPELRRTVTDAAHTVLHENYRWSKIGERWRAICDRA